MKIILFGMFLLIFSMLNVAQPKLNQPFEIKKGETVEIAGLKIKYLGGQAEWATGWGDDGKRLEIKYLRYKFEINNNGKPETKTLVKQENFGDYVLQILSPNRVTDNHSDENCRILLMNKQQFAVRQKQKETENADIQKLLAVKTFAIGPVGYAAVTSEGEILTRKILALETAETIFLTVLESGTPEAQLYSLWALRKIQGRASNEIFAKFRNLSTEVNRMSGCEIFTEKFGESVKEIENPFYLQMKAKDLWAMDLERRKAMLTDEEERFLLAIFRNYKSSGELEKIADISFGELFQKEVKNVISKL